MNNTLNLQGERLGLFNPITGLDNKSFAKVKKNVKRLIHDLQRGKMESDLSLIHISEPTRRS